MKGRIIKILSPRKIITGKKIHFRKVYKLYVRSFTYIHECTDLTKRQEDSKIIGAIVLGPHENDQRICFV